MRKVEQNKYLHKSLAIAAILFMHFSFIGSASAGNRALLIGTGEYQNSRYNLPGITYDIDVMEGFARKLGFQTQEIRTLVNDQVTFDNIKESFDNFLTRGVGPTDSILIYYTGHGTQVRDKNGDELDGRDEALTLYDLAPIAGGYQGVLIDDDIEIFLNGLPSKNILLVVDACHSGTVTRGFSESVKLQTRAYTISDFVIKALPYRGAVRTVSKESDVKIENLATGVVSLSAAQDNEQSLATPRGSVFTLALNEALDIDKRNTTPQKLLQGTSKLIRQKIDAHRLFRPNLTGDTTLFDQELKVSSAAERGEVNWSDLLEMVSVLSTLDATLNQYDYVKEEPVRLRVRAPSDGYLNVIVVDSEDSMVLLFPNKHSPDNHVSEGWINLPGELNFEWITQAPWGRNMLVTIFTRYQVNLFETSLQKDQEGIAMVDYAIASPAALREQGVGGGSARSKGAAGIPLYFYTCETAPGCK
ncbi:MAG: caspase family protein [Thiogranum sp.]